MRGRAPYDLFRVSGSPFWYVYFLDRDGRRFRRSTRETDQTRAHAVAREWERQHADPTYQAANETTFAVASGLLIEHLKQRGRSPDTRKFYEVKLGHWTRLFGADRKLATMSAELVDEYIRVRRREGASRHTLSKELTAMRMLLRVARRRGLFDREVSQVMPIGFDPGYVPRTTWLTQDQAWTLIRALPPGGPARYAAFVFATTARDRAVSRALGADVKSDCIFVRDRKTKAAWRKVPIVELTRPFAEFAFAGVAPDAQVAPGVSSMRHALERAAKRAGLPRVSPNDLRRSVAHWFHAAGVPINVAASFFGHRSIRMLLEVYGQLDPREVGEAIARSSAR